MTKTERTMFNVRSKYCLSLLSALLLNTIVSSLNAAEQKPDCSKKQPYNCNRLYIGAFGGEMFSNASKASQMGTALFHEDVGGPLAVEAHGHTKKTSSGFGGVQFGYEWSKRLGTCSSFSLAPTAEIEGYWLSRHIKGHLFNSTDTDRLPEHDFLDTFHMTEGVYLANFILSFNNTLRLSPYVGAGVGATRIIGNLRILSWPGLDFLRLSQL